MTGQELRVIVEGMMNDGMTKHEVLNVLGFSERTLRRYVKQEEIDKERVALINERLKAHESHGSSEQPTGGGRTKRLCPYRREQKVLRDGSRQERFAVCLPNCQAYSENGCRMFRTD